MYKRQEFERAKSIGRVFQDPMMGTAADMQIIENLAMAARRGPVSYTHLIDPIIPILAKLSQKL